MPFDPRPIILTGRHVRLEPLTSAHSAALFAAGSDPEIFKWYLSAPFATEAEVARWIDGLQQAQAAGQGVSWATVRLSDGKVVGSTSYLDIRRPHRALEIGNTWLAREAQRTAINTESKLLLLRHAFEELGAGRVQLKTDQRNAVSRRAIARLGAVEEGTLRQYQTRFDGYMRDTVMFSLIAAEWPAARAGLEARLR